jgi:signal peptidase I
VADRGGGGPVRAVLGFILNWIVIPAVIVLVMHNFILQAFHVVGSSMEPTLHGQSENGTGGTADYLIIMKTGAAWAKLQKAIGRNVTYIPKRDEIIVFHYPKDPSLVFVKRVIGLPGDHVVIKDGKVTVYNSANPNGLNPDANHAVAAPTTLGNFDDIVPAGNVFVLGDNRTPNGSFDSREWGYLPASYIIGNAALRLLPISQAKLLDLPLIR